MRSVVSLIEASPETICQDYRRAMELAGLDFLRDAPSRVLLARQGEGSFKPGFASPPWQLDGVLDFLAPDTADAPVAPVFPVQDQGPGRSGGWEKESGWEAVLRRRSSSLVPAERREMKPVHAAVPLPSLGAVLTEGFRAPPGLSSATGVLLPVPELNSKWQLSGSVALLTGLLAGKARKNPKIPTSEVVAEALALARQVLGSMVSVMDAVVWGVYREDGQAHPMIRNVILAGADPVAVDAVAARLAGLDPRRISWLQLCADRGLGVIDTDKLVIKGQKDLLGLDFQFPEGTFGHGPGTGSFLSLPGRALGSISRKKPPVEFPASAWGRLLASYRSGNESGESG
jgi:hypothetical protein